MKIRRIVVGLDIDPQSRAALAAAAMLAGELGAELEALFVESDELHRLAGMPFARETGFTSASTRRLDPEALERSLQAHAQEARRAIEALSQPRAFRWSLRVTRGSMAEEVRSAATGSDLTVVAVSRWGPEAVRLARETPVSLLVIPRSGKARGPLAALCPVAVAPEHAIALLGSLAGAVGDGLTIMVVGERLAEAKRWCEKATKLLDEQGRRARLEIVRDSQAEALEAALKRLAPRALAILAPSPTA